MTSAFLAKVPNGSPDSVGRVKKALSATCAVVSVRQVCGGYEIRYAKPTSGTLRTQSTVLRKVLNGCAWEGLPQQFKGDWLQSEAETTASGETSAESSPSSGAEEPVEADIPAPPLPDAQAGPEGASGSTLPSQAEEADPAAEPAVDDPYQNEGQQQEAEQVVYVEDFRTDLARLLKKEPELLGRIRRVEGNPPKYSVIDTVVSVTGKRPDNAGRAFDHVLLIDPDVTHLVSYISLLDSTGGRHQRTPVADIQTLLRVIVQLPCRGLGPLKREICEIFARFMGGDLSLIPELQANHARQQALFEEGSQSAAAAFGEYVRATRPPHPREVWRTPAPRGIGDVDFKHYVLGSRAHPDMCKTGSTKKPMDERLREIGMKENRDLGLYVLYIYHHEGALEKRVRLKLDNWGFRKPPAEYGVTGTEFRIVGDEAVRAAMDEVKNECEGGTSEELDEGTPSLRKRRATVEVEELEFKSAERRFMVESMQFELDQARQASALKLFSEHLEIPQWSGQFEPEIQRMKIEMLRKAWGLPRNP